MPGLLVPEQLAMSGCDLLLCELAVRILVGCHDLSEPVHGDLMSERVFDTDLGCCERFRAEVLPDFVGTGGQAVG
ncbi:hypothetical protein, partial [Kitasatospora sp. NPDC088861]|uniref:hypothetical protein n=1 Tax=Kitasatospora sp. NPDC088861 TaxID=3364078 RepID=UPI00381C5604